MAEFMEENVHIGEVKLASKGTRLKALLGSCVGIALMWRQEKLGTLAHCLLPRGPASMAPTTGRWVDVAILSSLQLLNATRYDYRYIEAVIAGGGNMLQVCSDHKPLVGASNVDVARDTLKKLRISVIEEDVGGEVGRRICLSGATLAYHIERIPRSRTP